MQWAVVAQSHEGSGENEAVRNGEASNGQFPEASRQLVSGPAMFAYGLHAAVQHFGLEFVAGGQAEIRFLSAAYCGDYLRIPVKKERNGNVKTAVFVDGSEQPAAQVIASMRHSAADLDLSGGEALETISIPIEGPYSSRFAQIIGDNVNMLSFAHPAVWFALAQIPFRGQVDSAWWAGTRCTVRHYTLVRNAAEVTVHATVLKRPRNSAKLRAEVAICHGSDLVAKVHLEMVRARTS
jgi:acyl-CoA thioesterase FadM